MNQLFKLKKDGKCVGYMKIDRYLPDNPNRKELCIFSSYPDKPTYWYENEPQFEWDAIHPFVCDDKNGNKVFVDDPCLLHCFSPPKEVYPKWHKEHLRIEFWENETAVMVATSDTFKRHIELIEEKK